MTSFLISAIIETCPYRVAEAGEFLQAAGLDPETVGPQIDGKFTSAFVRARETGSEIRLLRADLLRVIL